MGTKKRRSASKSTPDKPGGKSPRGRNVNGGDTSEPLKGSSSDSNGFSEMPVKDKKQKSLKKKQSKLAGQKGRSWIPIISVLIVVMSVAAGIYIYNFVDVTEVIDTVQRKVSHFLDGDQVEIRKPTPSEPDSKRSERDTEEEARPKDDQGLDDEITDEAEFITEDEKGEETETEEPIVVTENDAGVDKTVTPLPDVQEDLREDQSESEVQQDIPEINQDVPEVQQDIPDMQPDEPQVQQDVPEVQSEEPEVHQDVPEVQPDEKQVKPELPEVHPDEPQVQLDVPEVQQDVPEVQSEEPEVHQEKQTDETQVQPNVPEVQQDVQVDEPQARQYETQVQPEVAEDQQDVRKVQPEEQADVPQVQTDVPDIPDISQAVPEVQTYVSEAVDENEPEPSSRVEESTEDIPKNEIVTDSAAGEIETAEKLEDTSAGPDEELPQVPVEPFEDLPTDKKSETDTPENNAGVIEDKVQEPSSKQQSEESQDTDKGDVENTIEDAQQKEKIEEPQAVPTEDRTEEKPDVVEQVGDTHLEEAGGDKENLVMSETESDVRSDIEATKEEPVEETVEQEEKDSSIVEKAQSEPAEDESHTEKKPYAKADITNKEDNKIRDDLDMADDLVQKKTLQALVQYEKILMKYPRSPRANYGKAHALDLTADQERSNAKLEEAINQYLHILDLPDVPKPLLLKAGLRAAERQTFRGWGKKAIKTVTKMLDKYPDEFTLRNELGVKHLIANNIEDARTAFLQVLEKFPNNGYAMVHLGFIIKTHDLDYEKAIPYLRQGIETREEGTINGKFFYQLGEALQRSGRNEEAHEVHKWGAKEGVFMSEWQRSLYNVETLTARAWWTYEQTNNEHHLRMLEENWETIRDEGLANLDPETNSFVPEGENLREKGDWKQFTLYQQGRKNVKNCEKAPKTCALMDKFTDATGCKRGQVKFSVMQPGVHVWSHTGPTNCRIRAHLGLVIPEGVELRIVDEFKTWTEGKFIVFDDSFEHEVWHRGNSFRMVIIIDMWHPELTARQRATLAPI